MCNNSHYIGDSLTIYLNDSTCSHSHQKVQLGLGLGEITSYRGNFNFLRLQESKAPKNTWCTGVDVNWSYSFREEKFYFHLHNKLIELVYQPIHLFGFFHIIFVIIKWTTRKPCFFYFQLYWTICIIWYTIIKKV